jgi:hypothetical protein
MNKKILSIMAALVLMATTFVPFSKALAQGLVEYAIILVVVGFNKNTESGELIYYLPNPPHQAEPQSPLFSPVITLDFVIIKGGDPICTQTIQAPVETNPGRNVMTLAINDTKLVVNGVEVDEELDSNCFGDADRLFIEVAVLGPPGSDPTVLPAGFQPEVVMANVVGADGATRATGRGLFRHPSAAYLNPLRPIQ